MLKKPESYPIRFFIKVKNKNTEIHLLEPEDITTSKFSSGAIQFAKNSSSAKVKLVDGKALTKLMIKHNVGVSVENIYEIKK